LNLETIRSAARQRVLLSDCAMGTELQKAGLEPGTCGELWCLEHGDVISGLHRANIAAGADLVITNSFNGSSLALEHLGLASLARELNLAAAALAREAAGPDRWVLGDIGPFGGFLEPLGEYREADVLEAFLAQARALLEGRADGIIIETMSAPEELRLAVRAARQAGAELVIASATYEPGKLGLRTMMGATPADMAAAALSEGAAGVGANCGTRLTLDDYVELTRQLRAAAPDALVIVQSNAGTPRLEGDIVVYDESPARFAAAAPSLVAAGASILGGCCGTTPAHIAALARAMRA
jgi:5-methyltetrahydrofolate--homocysteine methyltransferase